MPRERTRPAVVLLSGGMDSAVTLAIARSDGFACHALSFDYGQRHRFELDAASDVAASLGAVEQKILKIDLRAFGGSAITADIAVPKDRRLAGHDAERRITTDSGEIPITYVPARNAIFLSFALAYAETLSSADIFIGVNAIDYSGYPDCRPTFIEAFERMANLATKLGIESREGDLIHVHAPLINMTKAQIVKEGVRLEVDFGLTRSCYDPNPHTGKPCEHCDACLLRAAGFHEAGVEDAALSR